MDGLYYNRCLAGLSCCRFRAGGLVMALLALVGCETGIARDADFLNGLIGESVERLYDRWDPPLTAWADADSGALTLIYRDRLGEEPLRLHGQGMGVLGYRLRADGTLVAVSEAPPRIIIADLAREKGQMRWPLECAVLVEVNAEKVIEAWRYQDPACPAAQQSPADVPAILPVE